MKRLLVFLVLFASLAKCQSAMDASTQLVERVPNDGITGTTTGQLAKINSSGNMVAIGTTDTNVPLYIVVGNGGTTGSAMLATSGIATCAFDLSGGTAGHYVQASTSIAADCHDAGSTVPTSGWTIGQLINSPGVSGTGLVLLSKGFSGGSSAGWQFLGTASSTTSTISVIPSAVRKHYYIRLLIAGYSGGGGIARGQFGNAGTVDTGTNYAFAGFNIVSGTSTAPTVTGIGSGSTAQSGVPVSGSVTTAGRFVEVHISNPGARIKYLTIETSGIGASAAVTPNVAHIAGTWNNTTDGIGSIQFQACSTINGSCTTVNFTTGTTLTVWGRDDN